MRQEIDDLLRRAGFAEPREDVPDAVVVSLGTHVGHGVDGEGDVESLLIGLSRGRLDAGSRRDARDHHLGDVPRFQLGFEIGAGEGAPGPLRHDDVAWVVDSAPG